MECECTKCGAPVEKAFEDFKECMRCIRNAVQVRRSEIFDPEEYDPRRQRRRDKRT